MVLAPTGLNSCESSYKILANRATKKLNTIAPLGGLLLVHKPPSNERLPMATAMEWVAKITTVSLEMVLPGIAGSWADHYFRTMWLAPIGFFLGFAIGFYHLLRMTRSGSPDENGDSSRKHEESE